MSSASPLQHGIEYSDIVRSKSIPSIAVMPAMNALNGQPLQRAISVKALFQEQQSQGSAVDGLVERSSSSAIKAVSGGNQDTHSAADTPKSDSAESLEFRPVVPQQMQGPAPVTLPSLASPPQNRMIVIPAGGLGKAAHKTPSPRKHSGGSRTPSGSVVVNINARAGRVPTPTRELDRFHVENRAPPRFMCPIGGRIMRDPIILVTGITCDRGYFERWLAKGKKMCPVTKRPLRKPISMTPNIELRNQIKSWARRSAPWLLDKDGHLISNEPSREELQGKDKQYVQVTVDEDAPGAAGASRSNSRIDRSRPNWSYTNGSKVRPGAPNYDLNAHGGAGGESLGGATGVAPWERQKGIAPPPRSLRSRSRSTSPTKKSQKNKRDWVSTIFLAIISVLYTALFIASLGKTDWKLAPLSVNPWYGPASEGLLGVGAQALPLMEGPGQEWWRIVTSPFVPAGVIHLVAALAGLWAYGRYAQMALPFPQASVPAVYLLSAFFGALASANLDAWYVSCGAFNGVLGLLGVLAADQAWNFKAKKLWNLKEWWLVSFIILLNAGIYITPSVFFPMTDPWGPTAGLVAGFLGSTVLLLLPKVGRGKPHNAGYASVQIISAILTVLLITASVVGCAMPTKLAESFDFLKDASCTDLGTGKWICSPLGSTSSGCTLAYPYNVASLYCPNGNGGTLTTPVTVPPENAAGVALTDSAAIESLCASYCISSGAMAMAPAPGYVPCSTIVTDAQGSEAQAPTLQPSAAAQAPQTTPTAGNDLSITTIAFPVGPNQQQISIPSDTVNDVVEAVPAGSALGQIVQDGLSSIKSTLGRRLRAGGLKY